MYEKICPECGKGFVADCVQKRYCCDECKKSRNRRNVKENSRSYRKKMKEGKKRIAGTSLAEINELARKSGMSYGQYVGHNRI